MSTGRTRRIVSTNFPEVPRLSDLLSDMFRGGEGDAAILTTGKKNLEGLGRLLKKSNDHFSREEVEQQIARIGNYEAKKKYNGFDEFMSRYVIFLDKVKKMKEIYQQAYDKENINKLKEMEMEVEFVSERLNKFYDYFIACKELVGLDEGNQTVVDIGYQNTVDRICKATEEVSKLQSNNKGDCGIAASDVIGYALKMTLAVVLVVASIIFVPMTNGLSLIGLGAAFGLFVSGLKHLFHEENELEKSFSKLKHSVSKVSLFAEPKNEKEATAQVRTEGDCSIKSVFNIN